MPANGTRGQFGCARYVGGVLLFASFCGGYAQMAAAGPSFEVATVKAVNTPFNPRHYWVRVSAARATYWSMTLDALVEYAYGIEPFQAAGPDWANAERFDIEATLPEGSDPKDDRRMLQALLRERFHLRFHVEKREIESYALRVGKRGARLTPSAPDPVAGDAAGATQASSAATDASRATVTTNKDGSSSAATRRGGTMTVKVDTDHWSNHFGFSKMTMADLAVRLSTCFGSGVQRVEDLTGIAGTFQVAFECPIPRPPMQAAGGSGTMLPADPQDGSLLLQSLDAMGLRLERRKVATEVCVIDGAERPAEEN